MYYVYRVEDESGTGPYNAYKFLSLCKMIDSHNSSPKHPNPFQKGEPFEKYLQINYPHTAYVFGFLYLEDLCDWFNGYFDLLQENGFGISMYHVPSKILCGKSQIAFLKEGSTKKQEFSFDILKTIKKQQ